MGYLRLDLYRNRKRGIGSVSFSIRKNLRPTGAEMALASP